MYVAHNAVNLPVW